MTTENNRIVQETAVTTGNNRIVQGTATVGFIKGDEDSKHVEYEYEYLVVRSK